MHWVQKKYSMMAEIRQEGCFVLIDKSFTEVVDTGDGW
jgi:hypothetical protein